MQASEEEIKVEDDESPFKISDGYLSCYNFLVLQGKKEAVIRRYLKNTWITLQYLIAKVVV